MSDMKYDAITSSGIEVLNRHDIPDYLVPPDSAVEIQAKASRNVSATMCEGMTDMVTPLLDQRRVLLKQGTCRNRGLVQNCGTVSGIVDRNRRVLTHKTLQQSLGRVGTLNLDDKRGNLHISNETG